MTPLRDDTTGIWVGDDEQSYVQQYITHLRALQAIQCLFSPLQQANTNELLWTFWQKASSWTFKTALLHSRIEINYGSSFLAVYLPLESVVWSI